ncbi:MAG: hypothetical protein ACJ8C4_09810 [Gemmataceae bacterium]
MSARETLNRAYFQSSIVVAALLGVAFSSWAIFVFAAAILLIGNVLADEIRLKPKKR